MPYFIDGHNLIPYFNGMSLNQIDDESTLANFLEPYFRLSKKKAVIYFDRAFPGSEKWIRKGTVQLRFVRNPLTADDAILNDLKKMGGEAKNYTVITSDQRLGLSAQHVGARVISSAEFSQMVNNQTKSNRLKTKPEDELEYWLQLFEGDS